MDINHNTTEMPVHGIREDNDIDNKLINSFNVAMKLQQNGTYWHPDISYI
jgi:hypothetical protein